MAICKGYVAKVCLLGDPAVGKTSLIHRYVYGTFEGSYLMTIGTNISRKDMVINGTSITLVIWDIAGQMRLNEITPFYYRGAMGAIAVVDITRHETFENIPLWLNRFRKSSPDAVVVLAINKTDLSAIRQINESEVKDLANMFHLRVFYTSAKTGNGVESTFYALAKDIMNHETKR